MDTSKEKRFDIMNGLLGEVNEEFQMLHDRWQEEKKYEDFKDYARVMKAKVQEVLPDSTFVRMSKRPFGIVFHPKDFPYDVLVFVNGKSFGWKSVKKT